MGREALRHLDFEAVLPSDHIEAASASYDKNAPYEKRRRLTIVGGGKNGKVLENSVYRIEEVQHNGDYDNLPPQEPMNPLKSETRRAVELPIKKDEKNPHPTKREKKFPSRIARLNTIREGKLGRERGEPGKNIPINYYLGQENEIYAPMKEE